MADIHAGSFPPAEQWNEDAFAALLSQPGTFGLMHPDGACVLARVAADEAELLTLAVSPAVRRRGLGLLLLRAAEAQAAAAGAVAMYLEVSERNIPACALYRCAGYQPVGRRRRYYPSGEDAVVLRAALTPGGAAAG